MTQQEMEQKLDECKSLTEAAQLMRDYYECPQSHTKVKTWVYMPIPLSEQPTATKFNAEVPVKLQCMAYDDIACLECKTKKNAAYESDYS